MSAWGKWVLLIIAILFILVCCCVVAALAVGGYVAIDFWNSSELNPQVQATTEIFREPVSQAALETEQTLAGAHVPENDLVELAERLKGLTDIPRTIQDAPTPYQQGDLKTFWVSNESELDNFQVSARLAYITDHVYFWVEEDVQVDDDELQSLAETFEQEIYPQTRAVFGSEWSPGIDNDPRIYMLYARGLGSGIAGYFSSRDSIHPLASEYSNAHEMFLFNADTVQLDQEFTYGVLAHEFQHMIHWNVDRNETTWLNEGMSELAAFLMGYDPGGFDWLYVLNTDHQLTYWPDSQENTGASYGSAFLFMNYFYDRFGEEVTQSLVAHTENGMESVDAVFAEWDINAANGAPLTGDAFFQDWVITNYLGDADVADGRYTYTNYPSAPQARLTETVNHCDGSWQERMVHQYGVDYIRITCPGVHSLRVEGSTEVGVLPVDAHSGEYMWWSNRASESDTMLTRIFDLSAISGEVTLSYWTWYDIEEFFDYLYVEASQDGQNWEILKTPGGTDEDPNKSSYGWGYTGPSGAWVQEEVDLSAYAGGEVWVRFEYVTDAAVNGEGFVLDDVQIPAIGYSEDFEGGEGGWEGAGFVRIANRLPQSYGLSLLLVGDGGVEVQHLEMGTGNMWAGEIEISGAVNEAILVVSGQARFTNQPAGYRFQID